VLLGGERQGVGEVLEEGIAPSWIDLVELHPFGVAAEAEWRGGDEVHFVAAPGELQPGSVATAPEPPQVG
jgi:hypothetical protein